MNDIGERISGKGRKQRGEREDEEKKGRREEEDLISVREKQP